MLRRFVTWVLRYAAHAWSRFGHPWYSLSGGPFLDCSLTPIPCKPLSSNPGARHQTKILSKKSVGWATSTLRHDLNSPVTIEWRTTGH